MPDRIRSELKLSSLCKAFETICLTKVVDFEPYISSGSSANDKTCYICGEKTSSSIKAVTDSPDSARRIEEMFNALGLFARIVPHDKVAPDIELGGCSDHSTNLNNFDALHRRLKTISLKSIVTTIK